MKKAQYKIVDLFGNEQIVFAPAGIRRPNLFTDYESFVQKFEAKKTTDDCYTPPEVYEIVLQYVTEIVDLEDKQIVRPFYPGVDYRDIEYTENMVVVDNPPFSILMQIIRFYNKENVKYFLFAPHLTLFSSGSEATHIVCGGDIRYENGAVVKTSFVTNMIPDKQVVGVPNLYLELQKLEQKNRVNLPKYEYPPHVLTVSMVSKFVERGIDYSVDKGHAAFIRELDCQKQHKKTIFGSGFLISEKAAAEKAAAEKAAAEKAAAEKDNCIQDNCIQWELSVREKLIIKSMEP